MFSLLYNGFSTSLLLLQPTPPSCTRGDLDVTPIGFIYVFYELLSVRLDWKRADMRW